MRRAGIRTFNKSMDSCPHCGSRKPKELVDGPKRFRPLTFLVFAVLTCGLALPLFFLFFGRDLMAHCGACDTVFVPRD